MATSKSRFTVAKLDAGVAAGSIIDLSVAQNTTKEKEEHDNFIALQNDIRDLFAIHPPSTPELRVRNMTQTSVVLEWSMLDLSTAEMKSLTLYKNGSKLGKIPNATTTTTKLSGLALDTDYTFQLVLRSTAGVYKSKELQVRTHKMTNLTGLNVCLSNVKPEERERLTAILERVGAKAPHDKVRIDTTHFVTNRGVGDEFKKAQNMNIPIVIPEFVEACEAEGRLMRVGSYYLDSDPTLRSKRTVPFAASVLAAAAAENGAGASTNPDMVNKAQDAESVLPVRTTSLTQETQVAHPTDTGVAAAVTAAVENATESARAGLEQVKNTIVEASQASKVVQEEGGTSASTGILQTTEGESISAAAAAPVSVNEEAGLSSVASIEPHQEAAKSVIDLPAQVADTKDEQTVQATTSSDNRVVNEDMEEVAL